MRGTYFLLDALVSHGLMGSTLLGCDIGGYLQGVLGGDWLVLVGLQDLHGGV